MNRSRWHRRWPWFAVGGLLLAAGFVWNLIFWVEAHRDRVLISVLDVGQGDAILIETPSGHQVLIDGGPDRTVLTRLGAFLPFWDRSLDLVVLTHPHADHLDGLIEVLRRYRVGRVLESGVGHSIPEYETWRELIRERKVPVTNAMRGQVIRLGDGVTLSVLAPVEPQSGRSPRNVHDAAIVVRLEHASSSALLMADAEDTIEYRLLVLGDPLRAELLKVGHHGSKTSTTEHFLAAVMPRYAVISSGRSNRYGHPAGAVLDRIAAVGATILRTDTKGGATFTSRGRGFELETSAPY